MARKFLYIVAGLIVLVIAGGFALSLFSRQATEWAFVPRGAFIDQPALAGNAYQDGAMWYARPGKEWLVRWQPQFRTPAADDGGPAAPLPAVEPIPEAPAYAVFFVHPTSYLPVNFRDDVRWNAPLGDREAENRARLFTRGMASPFASAAEIWAPRYRQAVFGAFLTDDGAATRAIDLAYRDVVQAFAFFVANVPEGRPIVLVGHSQGALHVLRLLREQVAGTALERRIAAVYPIGWPISVAHDLPVLPFPACSAADQPACITAWSSFAEPADASLVFERYESSAGFDGAARGDGPILCVNPLTGIAGGAAPAGANRGTLVPNDDLSDGELVRAAVPARCAADGLLLIGDPPRMGPGVLPGNNYHVYDIPLFWRNLQADVVRRVAAWKARR